MSRQVTLELPDEVLDRAQRLAILTHRAVAAGSVSASIPAAVKRRVRQQAENRCGYCRSRQEYVLGFPEIEHIIPRARGGTDDEENLWFACRLCNHF